MSLDAQGNENIYSTNESSRFLCNKSVEVTHLKVICFLFIELISKSNMYFFRVKIKNFSVKRGGFFELMPTKNNERWTVVVFWIIFWVVGLARSDEICRR